MKVVGHWSDDSKLSSFKVEYVADRSFDFMLDDRMGSVKVVK